VVAVAGGPAFTFSYAETSELLTAAGADVAVFDPLVDERLPVGARGLVVGGGFPQVHADALAANAPLRAAVAGLTASGGAVAAECAGLLFLATCLDGRPMCGAIDARAEMGPRLHLGYAEAVAASDSVLAVAGTRVHGHEFHRTVTAPEHGPDPAWRWRAHDGTVRTEGFVAGALHASYLHLHWAGVPGIAERFVGACARMAG
jgi:cobyrinic acid a,c-diamide synthase